MVADVNRLVPYSKSLAVAQIFALELARQRHTTIGPKELFAGMYVGAQQQFIRFFLDLDALENFLTEDCDLKDPIWAYWIRLYQEIPNSEGLRRGMLIAFDEIAARIVQKATELSKNTASPFPMIKLHHILLAAQDCPEVPICTKLMACGFQEHLARQLV